MQDLLVSIIYYLGLAIEYVGVILVIIASFEAVIRLLGFKKNKDDIRIKFAHDVILGLDFVIAADILLVTVAASLAEILQLGAIVVIRILLGYTLRQEFKNKVEKAKNKLAEKK